MENKRTYNLAFGQRLTEDEKNLIKNTWGGDKGETLKLLRKIFLPEYDAKAPLGQVIDLWMTIPTDGKKPEEILLQLTARNMLISHIENCLRDLYFLANLKPDETGEELVARLLKDSNK